jgi:hypothetical protein
MLEIALAELGAAEGREAGHEHAVIVDQAEVRAFLHDDVARLDVAVRYHSAQLRGTPRSDMRNCWSIASAGRGNECRERLAVRPVHPHDVVPLSVVMPEG